MGILSDIFHKIFPSSHPAVTQATAQSPAGSQQRAAPPAQPAPQGTQSAQGTPAQSQAGAQQQPQSPASASSSATSPQQQVDVEAILNDMQQKSGQQLNWRTSIVDLLKLLGLDSSLQARKELAGELHYTGDTGDSASMNIWLHKQVMNKLAENGGKVPDSLKD
jgi:hypothetical protein